MAHPAQAAHRIGITPRGLFRLIDRGALPVHKFGRVIRLHLSEVDRYCPQAGIDPEPFDPEPPGPG